MSYKVQLSIDINEEDLEDLLKQYSAKLTTRGEFHDNLVGKVDWHIACSLREEEYIADRMVLGINKDTFRPEINEKALLLNHDIYDLKDYVECFSIYPDDGCGYWELKNDAPFWQLAEKYITDVVEETRISQRENIKKISCGDFRISFHRVMYRYLTELNEIKLGKMPFYLEYLIKSGEERFLGVEPYSLKPFIGIIDGLDGCDIYDLKKIEEWFVKDENGYFVPASDKTKEFALKNESLIELFIQKYFTNQAVSTEQLPLIKTAEEHIIDDDSMFITVYKRTFGDRHFFHPTIIGKYYDTSYCEKYCFRPKSLQNFIELLTVSANRCEENTEKAVSYFYKAKEYKRSKKYKPAITALEKAITLLHDIEQTAYPEIHSCLIDCYAKIKDKENQIRVIKLATELYDSPKYKRMLNRMLGLVCDTTLKKDSYAVTAECNYGEMYDNHVRQKLPEFSFSKKPINWEVYERADMLPVIRRIDKHFQETLKHAKDAEMLEDYERAIGLYEQLIAEGIYTPNAYERLIVLYSKFKRNKDLVRILQTGITYFEKRKSAQAEYVMSLAKKYGVEDDCIQRINNGEKIRYYCGYIVLYQDFPFIEKWKMKLSKLLA